MKASAEKTASTTTSASTHETSHHASGKASEGSFFSPVRQTGAVQFKLSVSQAGDSFEQEADRMADKVMGAPAPSPVNLQHTPSRQLLRKESGSTPTVDAATQSAIGRKMTSGQPLSSEVRDFMEPRFGADFSNVRIHSDTESTRLSNRLSARAFTYQNHVFFSDHQYQPGTGEGKHLLAHELTHTLQQGHAVQRSAAVSSSANTPQIQRFGVQDALDRFAEKAHYLPGFALLSIVLGFNPINRRKTDRSAASILRALIEVLPGGAVIAQALDNHGVFTRAGTWVEQQLAVLGDVGSDIVASLAAFIDALKWSDILHLDDVWERAKAIFTQPIARLLAFAASAVTGLMALIKQAILRPLAALAQGTAAYDLLKAVLGQDPITGDLVPRTPQALIGGFMKLIGQQEVWENIQKSNAIGRAWAWFERAMGGLLGFARSIPAQIVETLSSITWQDVVTLSGVFAKVGKALVNVGGQFFSWAGAQVISLLEIIFAVVAPNAMPYIKKAQGAFRTIIQKPIAFAGNLVRAGRMGFELFAANIGAHLKSALIKWITGPLGEAGVYMPTAFSPIEIAKLGLSVLGLTWQAIRAKLVKIIPDPVLAVLEKTASVLVTLVREGPVAAWQEIKNELNALKDTMIAKVTEMITSEVVKAAVVKLVSMLNPAGAVIQAIIAVWNTINFFIEKINQIAGVVATFIDSIAEIAAGRVTGASKKVEQTMANTLTVIIAFLARFAGLGNIPGKLVGIIRKIRAPIDKGLDKIVAWLGNLLKRIGAAAKAGVKSLVSWWKKKVPVSGGGENHTLTFEGERKRARLVLRSTPQMPSAFLKTMAESQLVPEVTYRQPVEKVETQEVAIAYVQSQLASFDDNNDATATGKRADEADQFAIELDNKLEILGRYLGTTLDGWGVKNPNIKAKDIDLPRGSFSYQQKVDIAAQHRKMGGGHELRENKQGDLINVSREKGKELARRHVVSAHDMSEHYTKALTGKKASEAKLLLEQRGSIAQARTFVSGLTVEAIQVAAKTRYSKFFGYLRNMFIGDSRQNSAIQEKIDRYHPAMQKADGTPDEEKIDGHVRHMKRAWAIDYSITISGLDKQ
ncbi:DUF4157 domain-containing protein [Pseudomonas sp. NPDC090755]|uniref:eCIS core domain-containing protein n=1 Tax=Pseudomonas sp. NPDC090755 TaxID=3364481 RepID=UPI003839F7BC